MRPVQAACMWAGGCKGARKSNRSEAPPDGYRSDSTGIFDKFPSQRSSGSGREALRLPRPSFVRHPHKTLCGIVDGNGCSVLQ